MSFAAQARSLCPESDEHHDRVWFCLTCRMLEQRLRPISDVLRDVLTDADLTVRVNRESYPMSLLKREGPVTIKPPVKPAEPVYEDPTAIPDKPHSWGREWDGDYHQGRVCDDCGEYSECDMCNRGAYDGVDCLRVQANDRNDELRRGYRKALERYEAQMDYYRTLTEENH